jgi:hypothetical protein
MKSIADSAPEPHVAALLSRAWYQSSIRNFVHSAPEAVVGQMSPASNHAVVFEQAAAWMARSLGH